MGDGRAEGSSAIGDGGQAAISLTPDMDGTGCGSLLNSILSIKILYYCTLYSSVKYTKAQPLVEDACT